jgi:hypothetical protein
MNVLREDILIATGQTNFQRNVVIQLWKNADPHVKPSRVTLWVTFLSRDQFTGAM